MQDKINGNKRRKVRNNEIIIRKLTETNSLKLHSKLLTRDSVLYLQSTAQHEMHSNYTPNAR